MFIFLILKAQLDVWVFRILIYYIGHFCPRNSLALVLQVTNKVGGPTNHQKRVGGPLSK